MAKAKTFTIPKTLGACADALYELQQKRREIQKQIDEIEAQESAIKNHIVEALPKSESTGVSGKLANVKVVPKEKVIPTDWDKLLPWIAKNDAWDILQRRLNEKAIKDRWEGKKKVPGVDKMTVKTVSVTKI